MVHFCEADGHMVPGGKGHVGRQAVAAGLERFRYGNKLESKIARIL